MVGGGCARRSERVVTKQRLVRRLKKGGTGCVISPLTGKQSQLIIFRSKCRRKKQAVNCSGVILFKSGIP